MSGHGTIAKRVVSPVHNRSTPTERSWVYARIPFEPINSMNEKFLDELIWKTIRRYSGTPNSLLHLAFQILDLAAVTYTKVYMLRDDGLVPNAERTR